MNREQTENLMNQYTALLKQVSKDLAIGDKDSITRPCQHCGTGYSLKEFCESSDGKCNCGKSAWSVCDMINVFNELREQNKLPLLFVSQPNIATQVAQPVDQQTQAHLKESQKIRRDQHQKIRNLLLLIIWIIDFGLGLNLLQRNFERNETLFEEVSQDASPPPVGEVEISPVPTATREPRETRFLAIFVETSPIKLGEETYVHTGETQSFAGFVMQKLLGVDEISVDLHYLPPFPTDETNSLGDNPNDRSLGLTLKPETNGICIFEPTYFFRDKNKSWNGEIIDKNRFGPGSFLENRRAFEVPVGAEVLMIDVYQGGNSFTLPISATVRGDYNVELFDIKNQLENAEGGPNTKVVVKTVVMDEAQYTTLVNESDIIGVYPLAVLRPVNGGNIFVIVAENVLANPAN